MRFWIFILAIFLINFISASCNSTQIDVNSATAEELDLIVHVGNATAWKIINLRPYNSVDELEKVSGISAGYVLDIKEQGLACVEEEIVQNQTNEPATEESEIEKNESSTKITVTASAVSEGDEIDNINEPEISEVIKLNADSQEDIKSENSFGNLYSNWTMVSLGVFSVVIALLLLLKNKKRKNELI